MVEYPYYSFQAVDSLAVISDFFNRLPLLPSYSECATAEQHLELEDEMDHGEWVPSILCRSCLTAFGNMVLETWDITLTQLDTRIDLKSFEESDNPLKVKMLHISFSSGCKTKSGANAEKLSVERISTLSF